MSMARIWIGVSGKGIGNTEEARYGTSSGTLWARMYVRKLPPGQVAAMWNHARYMETQGRRLPTTLPLLTGQELADISAYLAGLDIRPPQRK